MSPTVPSTMTAATVEPASTAAMVSATAVESSRVAMEGAATMNRAYAATVIPASSVSAGRCAAITVSWVTAITIARAPIPISGTSITVTGATIIAPAAIVTVAPAPTPAVEPRTGADEYAIHEVVRTVVPVGRAGVRIVSVVSISAEWSCSDPYADWTNADAHRNLRVRLARRKKYNHQECKIF
jgi:hypothetical protein